MIERCDVICAKLKLFDSLGGRAMVSGRIIYDVYIYSLLSLLLMVCSVYLIE